MKEQLSGSPCVYGSSYGCAACGIIYVDEGCRGIFTVNNEDITCDSHDYGRVECEVPSVQSCSGNRKIFSSFESEMNERC